MQSKKSFGNQLGFTLIEMICVFVIISVLAATLFPKFLQADLSSKQKAIDFGVSELKLPENMTWAVAKVSVGTVDDDMIWTKLDKNLGLEYRWGTGPNQSGSSTLKFKETAISISRFISTDAHPGKRNR